MIEALQVRILTGRGDHQAAAQRLTAGLYAAEPHDQYATVWLAAECAGELKGLEDEWAEMVRKYAVQARALGYAPLVARLGAASCVDEAFDTSSVNRSAA